MLVAKLTVAQKDSLVGQSYDGGSSYWYPFLDGDGDWVVTKQEIDACTVSKFRWVKKLPITVYVPIP